MIKGTDGKMTPMQVYKAMQSETPAALPSAGVSRVHNSTGSYQWTEDWPMPPSKAGTHTSRPDIQPRGSQQTIHVGLQLYHPMQPFNIPRSS
jgi:hypothetical protein